MGFEQVRLSGTRSASSGQLTNSVRHHNNWPAFVIHLPTQRKKRSGLPLTMCRTPPNGRAQFLNVLEHRDFHGIALVQSIRWNGLPSLSCRGPKVSSSMVAISCLTLTSKPKKFASSMWDKAA